MHFVDYPDEYPNITISEATEEQFQEHYLRPLGDNVRYVRLESGFRVKCLDYMLMSFSRNAQARWLL